MYMDATIINVKIKEGSINIPFLEHPYPMIMKRKFQVIDTWIKQEEDTLVSKEKVDSTAMERSIVFDGKKLGIVRNTKHWENN